MYFHPVVFANIEEALMTYRNVLPWEGSTERAWQALAAIEYILVNRPTQTQLGEFGTTFTDLKNEAANLRRFLGVENKSRMYWQRTTSRGTM